MTNIISRINLRLCERYEVEERLEVFLGDNLVIPLGIKEVSRTGFKASSSLNIPSGTIHVKGQVGEYKLNMVAEKVWCEGGYSGFRLVLPCDEWVSFVREIENAHADVKQAA